MEKMVNSNSNNTGWETDVREYEKEAKCSLLQKRREKNQHFKWVQNSLLTVNHIRVFFFFFFFNRNMSVMMALKENETPWFWGPGPTSTTFPHKELIGTKKKGLTQSQNDVTNNLSGS